MADSNNSTSGTTATLEPKNLTSNLFFAKGIIFGKDRIGLARTKVELYDENHNLVGQTITSASGEYSVGLPKGSYTLEAQGIDGNVVLQHHFSLNSHDQPPLELAVEDHHEEHTDNHDDKHELHGVHEKNKIIGPTLEEVQEETDKEKARQYSAEKAKNTTLETDQNVTAYFTELGINSKDHAQVIKNLEAITAEEPKQLAQLEKDLQDKKIDQYQYKAKKEAILRSPLLKLLDTDKALRGQLLTKLKTESKEVQKAVDDAVQRTFSTPSTPVTTSTNPEKNPAIPGQQNPDESSLKDMGINVDKLKTLQSPVRGQAPDLEMNVGSKDNITQDSVRNTINSMAQYLAQTAQMQGQEQQNNQAQQLQQEEEQQQQEQELNMQTQAAQEEQTPQQGPRTRQQSRVPEKYQGSGFQKTANTVRRLKNFGKSVKNAEQAVQTYAKVARVASLLNNPIGWGIVGFLFFIILVVMIFNILVPFTGSTTPDSVPIVADIPGLDLELSGKRTGTPGSRLLYELRITYFPPINSSITYNDITVYYKIPKDTEFISSTGGSDVNNTSRLVSWKLSRPENQKGFEFYLQPAKDDIRIKHNLYATAVLGGESGVINPGAGKTLDRSKKLDALFAESATRSQVPIAFLKALAQRHSEVRGYVDEDIDNLSKPNWWNGLVASAARVEENDPLIIKGYGYNACKYQICYSGTDKRGVMQLTAENWNSIASGLSFPDGHAADRRYIKDSIIGAGVLVKKKVDEYNGQFNFTRNPNKWTEAQVRAMATIYCGGSPTAEVKFDRECGKNGKGYDETIWEYYREIQLGIDNAR